MNALGPGVLSRFFPVQEGVATKLTQRSESTAVFGEAGYALTDQLTLTAGVRWTDDKRIADPYAFLINATGLANTFVDDTIATSRLLVPTIPAMHIERDWKRWGGRGMLGYQGSANLLAYASVTRGFKGGDFNGGAMFSPVEANIVDPEYVTACEIGVKGALPEARLSYGLAGFIYDFTNQQIATLIPGSNGALQNLTNAAKSNIHGLEAEIGLTPIDALRLDVKAGYLDAEFKKFQLDPGNPATNYAGNRIPSSPKFSLNALARYTVPLAAQRSLSFGAELSHKSAHFFTADNNRAMCENGYWILNADVTFALNEKVSVKAWARNLGDTKYFVSGIATTGFGVMELMPGLPRTYGVTASAKF